MASLAGLVVLVTVGLALHSAQGDMLRVCYYTNWSQYRPGPGRFVPQNVDPSLCTHYVYAFASLMGNELRAFEWNDESTDWSLGMYDQFNALKQQNPAMKTLIAVGGWNMASGPFTAMVATPQSRAQFATSTVTFLRSHGFDGLDLDWEYPANRGSPPDDRDRFTALVREVRAEFDREAAATGQPRLLLTAAIPAGKDNIDDGYDVPEIVKYVDFLGLMTYDLHGSWETYTGHHSALYPRADETGDERYLNVDFAAQYWVQKGAPREKLIVGVASFGRSFTLDSLSQTGLGAPASQPGHPGTYTREKGFLAYYEVCSMLEQGAQVHDSPEQRVRYATLGDQWVGYEDVETITAKVCYIKEQGFGGVLLWALDEDDFSGSFCGKGQYPLLHAINNELNNPSFYNCPRPVAGTQQPVTVTPAAATTGAYTLLPIVTAPPHVTMSPPPHVVTMPPQTSTPGSGQDSSQYFSCAGQADGFYPSTWACDEYIICVNQVSYSVQCNPGLHYNPVSKNCDLPNDSHCRNDITPPAAYTTSRPLYTVTQRPITTTTTTQATWTLLPVLTQSGVTEGHTDQPGQPVTLTLVPGGSGTQQPAGSTAGSVGQTDWASAHCKIRGDGVYRNPNDCNQFVECLNQVGYVGRCYDGMVFNEFVGNCQHPFNTPECADYTP